ncbi:MAG: hydrolase [Alphaproteobacteria bacterium]|nr:hydrolase [Alphaproteobacteria bacterium]
MLMDAKRSTLVVIDLQERLMPAIDGADEVVRRSGQLIEAARNLDVPIIATEQYPKGLGPTVPAIKAALPNDAAILSKLTFSAGKSEDFLKVWGEKRRAGRDQVVICGTETHVCVLQTAADLKARGAEVFLVTDAAGSRTEANKKAAVRRLSRLGVACVTTEMVLFEWLEVAGTEQFKSVSKLIR